MCRSTHPDKSRSRTRTIDSRSRVFLTWEQGPYLMHFVTYVVLRKEYILALSEWNERPFQLIKTSSTNHTQEAP